MALPDARITLLEGALGQVPPSIAGASAKLGICSNGRPNTVYSFSDVNTAQASLGTGPLVEAIADTLAVAGGPVLAVPLNPTTQGTVTAGAHTGPGTGTVTPSRAPHQTIAMKVTTGGALATAQVAFSVNGGAYGAPVLTAAGPWSYLVPGTLTTVTVAAGTYVLNDVYTIATTGVVTLTGSGPAASNVTHAASPVDGYDILVTIVSAGGLGVGTFKVSVDGGNNTSGNILIPGGGIYAIPGTGVVLTFAGTFTAADTYAVTSTTAAFSTSDVTAAMVELRASQLSWAFVHVIGMGANAAAAASLAGVLDTQMTAAETLHRYVFGIIECPTSESDATIAAAFANVATTRIMACAGDVQHRSALTGRAIRRNVAIVASSRISAIPVGEDPAWPGSPKGALKNVRSLYGNAGGTTKWDPTTLHDNRFTTARQHEGEDGYYLTKGNMMAASGSDYNLVQRRRVIDVACRTARSGLLKYLNQALRVDKKTGFILELEALGIDRTLTAMVKAVLGVGGTPGSEVNASDAQVVTNRADNILSTNLLNVAVRVVPLAYPSEIVVNVGFLNPALQAV